MTIAVEAMDSHPNVGRSKLEEMVIVTYNDFEFFTRIPVKGIATAKPIPVVNV